MSNEQRTAISDHCIHGKHIVDRCEQCEADIAAGKGSGFTREQRTVERFFVAGSTGYKSFNDYGDCVKYEDYERLEKERDEQGRNAVELFDECQRLKEIERKLQADNKALREALEHARMSAQTGTHDDGVVISYASFNAVCAALDGQEKTNG